MTFGCVSKDYGNRSSLQPHTQLAIQTGGSVLSRLPSSTSTVVKSPIYMLRGFSTPIPFARLNMTTITSLKRISAKDLSQRILAERDSAEPTYAIIDVRDDDYLGGHIRGGIHAASEQLDALMPTLLRRLEGKRTVVFHCALSQQRGPSAALRYLRERTATSSSGESSQQEVLVLDRGFEGWRQVYGEDERLTEGYRKDLWGDH
ncbi:hypothetical protein MY5147_006139 [Beauveria neobassiana]